MRILFVTPNHIGLESLLFERDESPRGLLPHVKILEALIKRGDCVDLVVIHDRGKNDDINIGASWLCKANSIRLLRRPQSPLAKALYLVRLDRILDDITDRIGYDFVYIHDSPGSTFASKAKKKGLVVGQRAYGSFMNDWLVRKGEGWVRIRHYPEMALFKKKKDFLLVTNDGSGADKALKRLLPNGAPYDFYQWDNGVDRFNDADLKPPCQLSGSEPYLFYGARVTDCKGQHRGIEILKILRGQGVNCRLVIAGRMDSKGYKNRLDKMVLDYGLEGSVSFLGSLTQPEIAALHANALATLFFYTAGFNRGSSFLEALSAGSVVVVPEDDTSVSDLVIDGQTGITAKNDVDAAAKIRALVDRPDLQTSIRANAKAVADAKIPTWETRISRELDLIDRYCNHDRKEQV